VSLIELLGVVAVGLQVPLLCAAILIEFSQRKKRTRAVKRPAEVSEVEAKPASVAPRGGETSVPQEPAVEPIPAEGKALALAAAERESRAPTTEEILEETKPEARQKPATERAGVQPPPEQKVSSPAEAAEAKPSTGPVPPKRVAPPTPIRMGLRKTRENFLARLRAAITRSTKLDDIYEGLEEALIAADVGVETSLKLVEALRTRLKNDGRPDEIRDALKDEIAQVLTAVERPWANPGEAPLVIMLAGVNGAGKTTTIAKLAARMKAERGPVIVAAADTFRAAAIEQLEVWCERAGAQLIKQKQGSDPAAVAFDAVKAAIARKAKTVLIDTAGRLQTKVNLMEELKKVARVVSRELPGAPHEIWLVLDATVGQNALSQAKLFGEAVPLTGIVLAKLDSTAKGGIVVALAERLGLPVRFVGVGEDLEDLRVFDPRDFVEALFSDEGVEAGESQAANGSYAA
jgi:fused signal recognition particle receptor